MSQELLQERSQSAPWPVDDKDVQLLNKRPIEILRQPLVDRKGGHIFSVRVLQVFGTAAKYMTPFKIRELWVAFREHPVIFTDEIEGSFEAFFDLLMDPASVWFELFDEMDRKPKGVYYLTNVIPGYDATAHMAIWDGVVRERATITRRLMMSVFESLRLHRLTAEVPTYQPGTIRAIESIGFTREGTKREAVTRNGEWMDLAVFGILKGELEEAIANGSQAEREERDSKGDEGSS